MRSHVHLEPLDFAVVAIYAVSLLFLANDDPKADISLYVNSPGGAIHSGLGIIDTMNFVPCDVATYIIRNPVRRGLAPDWQAYPYSWLRARDA